MNILVIIAIAVGLAMDAFAVAVATSVSLGRVTGGQVFRFAFHFGLFQAGMPLIGWLAGRGLQRYIAAWDHWVAFGLLAFIGAKAVITALRSDADRSPGSSGDDARDSVVGRVPPGPPKPRSGDRDIASPDSDAPSATAAAPADLRRAEGDPPYIPEAAPAGSARPAPDPTRGWRVLALSVATSIDALAVGLSLGMLEVAIWYPALIIGVVTAGLTVVGMDLGSRIGSRFGRWTELAGGVVLIGIGTKTLVEHLT